MKSGSLRYILISRYITYIVIVAATLFAMDKTIASVVLYLSAFLILTINTLVRLHPLRQKPIPFMISICLDIGLILYLFTSFSSFNLILIFIAIVDVYLFMELKFAFIVSVPLLLSILYCTGVGTSKWDFSDTVSNVTCMTFFAGASYVIRLELRRRAEIQSLYEELKKSKEELEDANRKITEYARDVEELAVHKERSRLAGEIHDTIGHCLTALNLELEICGKLIEKDPEKTKEELKKAANLSQNALLEVRKSVRAIRTTEGEGLTGIRAITELLREFEKNTGVLAKLQVSSAQYSLTPATEVTIYRTIQEALTNSVKHGGANTIQVGLQYLKDRVELTVRDNGKGCSNILKGTGISTMEERIRSLGGNVEFQSEDGFVVRAEIPVEAA